MARGGLRLAVGFGAVLIAAGVSAGDGRTADRAALLLASSGSTGAGSSASTPSQKTDLETLEAHRAALGALIRAKELAAAIARARQALALANAILSADRDSLAARSAKAYFKLVEGYGLERTGAQEEARLPLALSRRLYADLLRETPTHPGWNRNLRVVRAALARLATRDGDHAQAGELYNSNVLNLGDALQRTPGKTALRWEYADTARRAGVSFLSAGDPRSALTPFKTAIEEYRRLGAGDKAGKPAQRVRYAVAHNRLGDALAVLGRHAEAAENHRAAIELSDIQNTAETVNLGLADIAATSYHDLGKALYRQGEMESGRQALETALLRWKAILAAPSKALRAHDFLMSSNRWLARIAAADGDWASAGGYAAHAISHAEAVLATDPANPAYFDTLIALHQWAGDTARDLGVTVSALQHHTEAYDMLLGLLGSERQDDSLAARLVLAEIDLGDDHYEAGENYQAAEWYRTATGRAEAVHAGARSAEMDLKVGYALNRMGFIFSQAGASGTSGSWFDRSVVLATRKREADPDDPEWAAVLGAAQFHLGRADLENDGDATRGVARLNEAAEAWGFVLGLQPENRFAMDYVSAAHELLGWAAFNSEDFDGAGRHAAQGIPLIEQLLGPEAAADILLNAASLRQLAGELGYMREEYEAALADFRREREIRRRLVDADPEDADVGIGLAANENAIGDTLREIGRYGEAVLSFDRALSRIRALSEKDPGNMDLKQHIADGAFDLAEVHFALGNLGATVEALRLELQAYKDMLGAEPDSLARQRETAAAHRRLAKVYLEQGDQRNASNNYVASVETMKALFEKDARNPAVQSDLANSYWGLGVVKYEQGAYEEALRYYLLEEGLRVSLAQGDPEDSEMADGVADVTFRIASSRYQLQRYEETVADLQSVHAIRSRQIAAAPDDPVVLEERAEALSLEGWAHYYLGNFTEGLAAHEAELLLWKRLHGQSPNEPLFAAAVAWTHRDIADLHYVREDRAAALAAYRAETAERRAVLELAPQERDYRRELAESLKKTGIVAMELDDHEGAEASITEELSLREALLALEPFDTVYKQDLASTHRDLGDVYAETGRTDQSLTHYRKALSLRRDLAADAPDDPEVQRSLAISLWRLAEMGSGDVSWDAVVEQFKMMDDNNLLYQDDVDRYAEARSKAGL